MFSNFDQYRLEWQCIFYVKWPLLYNVFNFHIQITIQQIKMTFKITVTYIMKKQSKHYFR